LQLLHRISSYHYDPQFENEKRYCKTVELSYGKVSLENLWPAIRIVATDLTDVAKIQSVKLVQPVRNRLEEKSTGY